MGTAGVVLAAAWSGGDLAAEIMSAGGESLLRAADRTEAGLDWRMRPGYPASTPNYSHGTAGVATALAIAGHARIVETSSAPPGRAPSICSPWAGWTTTGSLFPTPCLTRSGRWSR